MARKKKIDEKEQQVSFASLAEIEETAPKEEKKTTRKKSTTTTKKKTVPKKDRKINITQEDMDKLCEVYDWYLSVKDTISYNAATEEDTKNKDVVIEETDLKDTKKAYLNIDRQTWEDFDVLCSNCGFKKNEVLTQIIKDFLREHRNLF
ncbi:DNA-binding protein [Peptacetobacter sp.]|uniref:DNA-binding protein n=1 Tax=unclassified Peptacetobacter TaxID=2991974 RepID=UPI002637590F|nr:DNA-binding protein [Peptacetobacter sp.]MEE0451732.1 DNA-binding protein [Peptacetobacter sp.]